MEKSKKLVIIGDSAFAEVAYEYFTHDSPYHVVGFSVESAYLKRDRLFGLPIVPFEALPQTFAPGEVEFFAALVYTQLNRLRTRLYDTAKQKGYRPASYISSRAFVWPNVKLGEHCFIFEDNTVQPFVKIGNDVTLWSGNHIGHDAVIDDHCFISSHVVISGRVHVREYCFLGVNATIRNGVTIAPETLVGAGSIIMTDTEPKSVYVPERTAVFKRTSDKVRI